MSNNSISPDYLFEVSWEVCNKIGGIHTVISTKAISVKEQMDDRYMVIGPDVWRGSDEHPEFDEDDNLFADWRKHAISEGLMVRTGRWKIKGEPIAILVDFTPYFNEKDEIFSRFWELYRLDSISVKWVYIEPTFFGYATGKAIDSYIRYYGLRNRKVVAHFHEWMTGAGLLYLKDKIPQVGTVFTTHATVVGRSIAGNNQPLYSKLENYNGDEKAKEFNVFAKQSIEKIAAQQADAFTTVSDITARECAQFHGKPVDIITPNGFEDSFVPDEKEYRQNRMEARGKLLKVASLICGEELPEDTVLMATSGRYEFRNKGIDLFMDALGEMNKKRECSKKAVAFILVPANHYGPRKDLMKALLDPTKKLDGDKFLTHYLHYSEHDPVIQRLQQNAMKNSSDDVIKVIFVPSYLKGADGIFDLDYFNILIGFDLTVFPSYYEPWGYTPMESLAFKIPTITTTLAGFGIWVNDQVKDKGNAIHVIPRTDGNDSEVVRGIGDAILSFCNLTENERAEAGRQAHVISRIALWENLISFYWKAYSIALERSVDVELDYQELERVEQLPSTTELQTNVEPVWRTIAIQQLIPDKLRFLEELARNIWWSWTKEAADLFKSIDPKIWASVHENPIVLLEEISFDRLKELENDKDFLENLKEVHRLYTDYI
nr:DUF3417 domain-containing protein [Bacteroidales bacterium]